MRNRSFPKSLCVVLGGAALGLTACSAGGSAPTTPSPAFNPAATHRHHTTTTPIQHVVIVIQENRTFDNFFATFPGADGATYGYTHDGKKIRLKKKGLVEPALSNGWTAFLTDCNGTGSIPGSNCQMNGFDQESWKGQGPAGKLPYQYVNPNQIKPYWDLAKQYVLSDHMFQGEGSGSFTAHQELIAGGSMIDSSHNLIDWPVPPTPEAFIWGCDAPAGTVTTLITQRNQVLLKKGPFPCFTYASIADQLDANSISWRYYSGPVTPSGAGGMWNGFDAIDNVRHGPDWQNNIFTPSTQVLTDVGNGTLASVTWVTPSVPDSDHEYDGPDHGPSWVAQVVNAIGKSPMWSTTAIVVVWDDWGGHFDHVAPQQYGFGEVGFRVPCLIVSPYVHAGKIDSTPYEFGSILKFIEDNWSLHPVQNEDARATSIGDAFDFNQNPRAFVPIKSALSRQYFEHEQITNLPGDD